MQLQTYIENVRQIRLPERLRVVSEGWFAGSRIEEVFIPASVKFLDREAFRDCAHLKKVVFSENSRLERVQARCFQNSGILEFAAHAGLRTIEEGAFYHCGSLRRVLLRRGLKELGKWAFAGCCGLQEVRLPRGLRTVPAHCFEGAGLCRVSISRDVSRIDEFAFFGCRLLRDVQAEDEHASIVSERGSFGLTSLSAEDLSFVEDTGGAFEADERWRAAEELSSSED